MRSKHLFTARPIVLTLALALTLAACNRGGENESAATTGDAGGAATAEAPAETPAETQAEDERLVRRVRTAVPTFGTLEANRRASATVRALQDANVAAGSSGRVVGVNAAAGDFVSAGTAVIELDRDTAELNLQNAELSLQQAQIELDRARRQSGESLEQAQASLRAAESNLRNLRDQLEQVRELVEQGAAPRNDLTNLEAQVDSAESQFVSARDGVARAERSEEEDLALLELRLEQARVARDQSAQALEETRIEAPFDGVVAELLVEPGEFAAAGSPVFRLQSDTERELVFNVAPEDAAFLLADGTVDATYAGRELSGRIVANARPSQQARLVEIRATFDTDGGPTVPTGATAQVTYTVPLAEGYLVPSGALTSERGQTFVFVAQDGIATRIPVSVLGESTATAAIEGVSEDDAVIVPLPLDVREGTRVRVVE